MLRRGVEVLVATPGRLLDHIEQRNTQLSQVEIVVLDEADRMLDMGFLPDISRILKLLPSQRQSLMFSATFSPEIKSLAANFLNNPKLIEVARENSTAKTITQKLYEVHDSEKVDALMELLDDEQCEEAKNILVFVNSKITCRRLTRTLERNGYLADSIHGDKTQDERIKTLEAFKTGAIKILVATDVAARGLDIADLPVVINFDVPFNAEDYVHRIGRTGRAGSKGLALMIACPGAVYTGVTSVSGDQSNVGFVLMNQRTMETKFYPVEGATEESAQSSAEGQVQNLKYRATFPLLLNISGEPTYFIALKDDAGLVKKYAMVNVQKYQLVAIGDTVSACEEQYHQLLVSNGVKEETEDTREVKEATGKITKIAQSVVEGNSHYYIMLEGSEDIFDVAVNKFIGIIRYNVGDELHLEYKEGEELHTVVNIE